MRLTSERDRLKAPSKKESESKLVKTKKALEEDRGAGRWLIYWLVLGCFNLVEFFADILLAWFPFYFGIKLAFLVINKNIMT